MKFAVQTALMATLVLAGCSSFGTSGQKYDRAETKTAYSIEYGKVVAAEPVEIEGEVGIIGTWGGATVGAAAGSGVGDGTGRYVSRAVGGVVGAVVGQAVEKEITSENGLEIVVDLDDGGSVAIVQANDVAFAPGDRVRVLFGPRGSARVRPL